MNLENLRSRFDQLSQLNLFVLLCPEFQFDLKGRLNLETQFGLFGRLYQLNLWCRCRRFGQLDQLNLENQLGRCRQLGL